MWSSRTIEQELEATKIETAPKAMFIKHFSKNNKIVDAGCGFGKWVIFLTHRGYNIIGIDNNELAITKLKEFDSSINVELGNILNLDYPDNSFDAYISMGVIEHFEEGPMEPLKEAYRVLKPGGLIFVSTPTVNIIRKIIIQPILNIINTYPSLLMFPWQIKKIIGKNLKVKIKRYKSNKSKTSYRHFLEYRFSIKELTNFLKQSNFKIIETLPHDFPGSKNHAIGLAVDFPFLKDPYGYNFKLNSLGKLISRILDYISPWIACASVLCVGKSLKK